MLPNIIVVIVCRLLLLLLLRSSKNHIRPNGRLLNEDLSCIAFDRSLDRNGPLSQMVVGGIVLESSCHTHRGLLSLYAGQAMGRRLTLSIPAPGPGPAPELQPV